MTRGLNLILRGGIPITHSPTVNGLLYWRGDEVGCLKTTTEPSSPLSQKFPNSFFTRFRISDNALKI